MELENLNNEEEILPTEEIQYEADSVETGTITTSDNYKPVKDETVLVDPTTGAVIDVKTLPPFERIKFVSERMGKKINDPDKNCKKCYGRGYVNIDANDGVPTPCQCIFHDFYEANPYYKNVEYPSFNRATKRAYERQAKKKHLPNHALEKRQKRMNDLMKDSIKKMLAKEALENAELETAETEVIEQAPFDGVESAEFTPIKSEE